MQGSRLFLLLALLFSPLTFSAETDIEKFRQAYTIYQQSLANGDNSLALNAAQTAFNLGKSLYPDKQTLVSLAINYGSLEPDAEKAEEALTLAVDLQAQLTGNESIEMIDPHMELGGFYLKISEIRSSRAQFKNAIEIASAYLDDEFLLANLNLEIGEALYPARDCFTYLNNAKDLYSKYDDQAARLGVARTNLSLASYEIMRNKNKAAEPLLLEAFNILEEANINNNLTLRITTRLIQVYEDMKEIEKADHYLRKTISLYPPTEEDEYPVLIRHRPAYPLDPLLRGIEGWALMTFTIDERGYVINALATDFEGSPSFKDAAFDALEKFRFIPGIDENGELIRIEGAQYVFSFTLID